MKIIFSLVTATENYVMLCYRTWNNEYAWFVVNDLNQALHVFVTISNVKSKSTFVMTCDFCDGVLSFKRPQWRLWMCFACFGCYCIIINHICTAELQLQKAVGGLTVSRLLSGWQLKIKVTKCDGLSNLNFKFLQAGFILWNEWEHLAPWNKSNPKTKAAMSSWSACWQKK